MEVLGYTATVALGRRKNQTTRIWEEAREWCREHAGKRGKEWDTTLVPGLKEFWETADDEIITYCVFAFKDEKVAVHFKLRFG